MEISSFFRRSPRQPAPAVSGFPTIGTLDPDLSSPGETATAPRDATGFASCSWLLDHQKQIIAYRLGWQTRAQYAGAGAGSQLQSLVNTAAQGFSPRQKGWALGKIGLMFDATPESVATIDWCGLPSKNVVLCWQSQDFANPETGTLLQSLRQQGFGHMLCGEVPEDKERCELVTHFDVGAGDALAMATCRAIARRPVRPVATRWEGWAAFDACASRRVPVFVSPAQEPPVPKGPRPPLQPETLLIVRVLQMVQRNEDVREIEAALKHDVALTVRFLQHINSPAVAAGVEIASLRHAVAMLGYKRLFRWLSMLLATTDVKSSPPYLMKKAIVRGRMVELLGQALLGPPHADNLFLVGMFSAIDQLLGVTMEELFQRIQLGDSVKTAILEHGGVYGPFLALALACESESGRIEGLAEALFMSANQVNDAHLGAIVWAQEVSRSDALY